MYGVGHFSFPCLLVVGARVCARPHDNAGDGGRQGSFAVVGDTARAGDGHGDVKVCTWGDRGIYKMSVLTYLGLDWAISGWGFGGPGGQLGSNFFRGISEKKKNLELSKTNRTPAGKAEKPNRQHGSETGNWREGGNWRGNEKRYGGGRNGQNHIGCAISPAPTHRPPCKLQTPRLPQHTSLALPVNNPRTLCCPLHRRNCPLHPQPVTMLRRRPGWAQ